ncbi:MAG: hypothetical protein A2Y17_01610 [Clostridiales bacterium GWF2_38_85]|nr:MAG: hypothetical protein A2Y17_01610 [Clostridiales bacterium GWF2_38_85]HBL84795.1 zinc ribbon domain-containing protein [Clostridiales bacterium]
MPFCSKCGAKLEDGIKFCSGCGAPVGNDQQTNTNNQSSTGSSQFNDTFKKFTNTADSTAEYDRMDIEQNKVMAVLAYLGILVLVPILAAPNSKYAKFHANQGLILIIASIAYGIASSIVSGILWAVLFRVSFIPTIITLILNLAWLAFTVFHILGIVNAAQSKAKELPLIGKFRILK